MGGLSRKIAAIFTHRRARGSSSRLRISLVCSTFHERMIAAEDIISFPESNLEKIRFSKDKILYGFGTYSVTTQNTNYLNFQQEFHGRKRIFFTYNIFRYKSKSNIKELQSYIVSIFQC